jgi:hypothetical protein
VRCIAELVSQCLPSRRQPPNGSPAIETASLGWNSQQSSCEGQGAPCGATLNPRWLHECSTVAGHRAGGSPSAPPNFRLHLRCIEVALL